MSDERVLAWLNERPLEELTAFELAEIRIRLSESAAVREALAGRLRIEQALHQTVGHVRLPVELLLAKAAAIKATGTIAKLLGWGSATGLMIGIVSVSLVASRGGPVAQHQPPIAAQRADEPSSPSDVPPGSVADIRSAKLAKMPKEGMTRQRDALDAAAAALPLPPAADEIGFASDREAAVWRGAFDSLAGDVIEGTVGDRPALVLHGTQVLNRPWPAEGRLRLRLAEHDRFKIHLSHTVDAPGSASGVRRTAGPTLLTLEHFALPQPMWVAWLAARRTNQLVPETLALAAHDEGRLSKMGAGTFDLEYHEGHIVVAHGATTLLAAPLAGVPDRIAFDGDAVLHGIEFADGMAAQQGGLREPMEEAAQPATHDWRPELPLGATWNVLPAGRVELLAEDTLEESRAVCQTAHLLGEIVLELEDPLPGTGLYLSDARDEGVYRLAFVSGPEAEQVCFALTAGKPALACLPDRPTPVCPARVWFKLSASEGVLRGAFSCDGAYWSPLLSDELALAAPLSTVGLYCTSGPGSRSLRVAHLALRPPDEQASPAPDVFGAVRAARQPAFLAWRRE